MKIRRSKSPNGSYVCAGLARQHRLLRLAAAAARGDAWATDHLTLLGRWFVVEGQRVNLLEYPE